MLCKNLFKFSPKFFNVPQKALPLVFKPFKRFTSLNTNNKKTATGIPTNIGFDHVGIVVPNVKEAADFLIEVFDAEFDWEVKREARPTFGERGWDKTFGVHPEAYMPHVMMLKCGDNFLTQYVELFEFTSPDQFRPPQNSWLKFSDIGFSYISFTVKDLQAVMEHIKKKVIPKWKNVRFIQDPPMSFPLRGEVCTSTFLVSPWGQWIELTCWSKSQEKVDVIKAQRTVESHPLIGKHIFNLPTPSFLVDLDVVDHNVKLMRERFQQKNIQWRVPCKAHKCPGLTNYILEKGQANGVVLLTLGECESFADNGIQDIYFANQVASKEEINRLSLIPKKIKRLRVAVDNMQYLEDISQAVKAWEITTPIEVLIELNINHNRCGVTVEEAVNLCLRAKELEKTQGSIIFKGITGYEGHTPVLPPEEKTKETRKSHEILAEAKRKIEEIGVKIDVVSAGGSCNYIDCLNMGVVNEIQAGGGAIGDILYCEKAHLQDHGHKMGSLILASIISMPNDRSRAMGNAGFKAVGWHPFGGLPRPRDRKDIKIIGLSAEHTKFESEKGNTNKIEKLERGDKIVLIPGYTDSLGFLHRTIYGIRNDTIENVWKTASDKTWS